MSPVRLLLIMLCAGVMSACTTEATPEPVATQTLIPVTATFTPQPVTPTSPPATLPEPQDIASTPSAAPILPVLNSDVVLPDVFVQQMMDDLAGFLLIDVHQIRYARLDQTLWLNNDLGCTLANLLTKPVQTFAGYRLTFVVGKTTYEYHTVGTERFRRCAAVGVVRDDLLVAIDPVALEMVGLAQRQVAQTLDLPVRRIRPVAVESYTWRDTGLGCPQENGDYQPAEIPGYRILVAAGENEYLFHTDSERLYPCEKQREKLPG